MLEQDFGRQIGWTIRVPLVEDRYLRLIFGQIDRIDEPYTGWSNLWYGYRLIGWRSWQTAQDVYAADAKQLMTYLLLALNRL